MAEAKVEKKPNLLDCDASELAAYLLQHRFNDNGMATASFLLECTSTLPNAEAISAQLVGHDDDDDDENGDGENEEKTEKEEEEEKSPGRGLGNSLTETCTVSMTAPRGKFQMTLFDGGMQCVNGKGDTLVITSAHKIVVFPSPQDCRLKKKGGADMVLLCLDNDNDKVAFQEKSLTQVCFALPAEDDSSKMTWIEVLCKSLVFQEKEVIMAQDRKGYTFESFKEGNTSTTTGGMPFVQCYYGVKDGVLFPMKQGLLFFKPPMFLHRSALHSIACGRGSGGSRYVDMALTLDDETTIEFTNIHRDELNVLNTYIHSILIPAMKKDANEVEHVAMMDQKETNDSLGKRKRSQRKASQQARQATRAELDDHQGSDSDDDGDDEGWEEAHRDKESNDDESDQDDESENNGDGMEDDAMGKQKKMQPKRTQRKASQEALEATRAELLHHEESDSEDDEEEWEEGQHDKESDYSSDEGDKQESSGGAVVDDAEEETFFEEEDFFENETATESDDEGESSC